MAAAEQFWNTVATHASNFKDTIFNAIGNGLAGIGNGINKLTGTEASNAAAAVEAEKQRTFEHDEAQAAFDRSLAADSTKIQRQVADMQAAGLNPAALAGFTNVTGSSSVSAPAASGAAASTHAPANWLGTVATIIGAIVLKGKAGVAAKAASALLK